MSIKGCDSCHECGGSIPGYIELSELKPMTQLNNKYVYLLDFVMKKIIIEFQKYLRKNNFCCLKLSIM